MAVAVRGAHAYILTEDGAANGTAPLAEPGTWRFQKFVVRIPAAAATGLKTVVFVINGNTAGAITREVSHTQNAPTIYVEDFISPMPVIAADGIYCSTLTAGAVVELWRSN